MPSRGRATRANRRGPSSLALALIAASLAVLARAHRADAQPIRSGGYDLHLFRPAVDSKGQFAVNGTDVLGAWDLAFGLVVDYGRGLARIGGGANGAHDRALVDNDFTGTLLANVGLFNWLVVGLQLPVVLLGGPGDASLGVANYAPLSRGFALQGASELAVDVKLRLLHAERGHVGLALLVRAGIPFGNASSWAGDPGLSYWPSVAFEWRPAPVFRLDINAGYHGFTGPGATVGAGPGATYAPSLTAGLGASVRVFPALELVAETYAANYTGALGRADALPWEAVGGLKVFVQRNSFLMLGAGTRVPLGNAYAAADLRAFVGIVFEPSVGDTDGDGYRDDVDRCPSEPEDFDGFEDQDGCPDPDNDRDGILDTDDLCPNEAEDRDGFEDANGCPDPDNDHDRIPDVRDRCPNEPESYDGFEDDDGCPDHGGATLEDNRVMTLAPINFETSSARIRPDSLGTVEAVARMVHAHPEIRLIEVQGHADERGDDGHNVSLTRDRAASVVRALIERGVEPDRLHSAGYGERCRFGYEGDAQPARDNAVCQHGGPHWCHSERAWRRDRRVVFQILRTETGPLRVRVACPEAEELIPEADRAYHARAGR